MSEGITNTANLTRDNKANNLDFDNIHGQFRIRRNASASNLRKLNNNSPYFSSNLPTFTTIEENKKPGTEITTITLVNTDNSQNIKYELYSNHGNLLGKDAPFTIDNNGKITTSRPLQYEEENGFTPGYGEKYFVSTDIGPAQWYILTIKAITTQISGEQITLSHTLQIQLKDVAEAPKFIANTPNVFTISENMQVGETIGIVHAISPDEPNIATPGWLVHYMIDSDNRLVGGNFELKSLLASPFAADSNLPFTIDKKTGEITLTKTIDFEKDPKSYNLKVIAHDRRINNAGDAVFPIIINVENYNEAPIFSPTKPISIYEDTATGTIIGKITAKDPEGSKVRYSIAEDNLPFTINNDGEILVSGPLDYESKNKYIITIMANSGEGNEALTTSKKITINIGDVDEDLKFSVETLHGFSVDENSPAGTIVGKVTAIDPEGLPISYGFVTPLGDPINDINFPLKIDPISGEITATKPLKFESNNQQYILVRAYVPSLEISKRAVDVAIPIKINNVDEEPIFSEDTATNFTIAENNASGAIIGKVKAIDPDGDPIEYLLLNQDGSTITTEFPFTKLASQ